MKISSIIDVLDNDENIINQELGGMLIWPIVRYVIIQHFIDKSNQLNTPKSISSPVSTGEKIFGAIKAIIKCPYFGPKKPVLIFNTAASSIKRSNGSYFNRITGYFYDVSPKDTWIIEDPIGFWHPSPNVQMAYSKLTFNVFSEFIARFILVFVRKHRDTAQNAMSLLFNNINRNMIKLNFQIEDEILKKKLIKSVLRMKPNYWLYRMLFRFKKINAIIIEDGYYGLEKAIIIKAAKDLGVRVIEPQHGFINENHPSYNYGEKILQSITYKLYMPDVLLCYGDFWANGIQIPNKKYILGNPHLEESLKYLKNTEELKKILVLGSGITIEETNSLLSTLLLFNSRGYEVVYRPHPQEKFDVSLRYGTQINNGVKIDDKDLYLSMAESDIIIGELSTTIFEAIALQKKIFLYNSSYTQAYFNERIKYFKIISLKDVSTIFDPYIVDKGSYNYYWKKDWQDSYLEFRKLFNL